jgi:uridine kinase
MKVITLAGAQGCGKSVRAQQLYEQYMREGKSVAMIDTDSYGNYYSDERARTKPDVRIVTKLDHGKLRETTKEL